MAREKSLKVVLTFPGTTQAMKMEKAAREAGVPGRLIPVPSSIRAGCGMAWCAPLGTREQLTELAAREGIEWEEFYERIL